MVAMDSSQFRRLQIEREVRTWCERWPRDYIRIAVGRPASQCQLPRAEVVEEIPSNVES